MQQRWGYIATGKVVISWKLLNLDGRVKRGLGFFHFNISKEGGCDMNKGDLVNEVAKVVGTKKEAQAAVDCVFSSITKALKKKQKVTLIGFGTFKVDKRKARKGVNPQTGEKIKIKAKRVPKFVPGKALKEAV